MSISPKPNNGTLRLPLHPVGLHPEDLTAIETPPDPPVASLALPASTLTTNSISTAQPGVKPSKSGENENGGGEGTAGGIEKVWDTLLSKAAGIEDWIRHLIVSDKGKPDEEVANR